MNMIELIEFIMEMKKNVLILFVAAAALVGCTKSEIESVDAGDVEIALRSNVIDDSGVSRAPFAGAISPANALETRVIASKNADFSALYANGLIDFKGNPSASYKSAVGTTAYPAADAPVYLYGLYPSTWTISSSVGSAFVDKADFVFTGKEDVMATDSIVSTKASDVIGASPVYAVLPFKHLLTRLEVRLSGGSVALDSLREITAIQLVPTGGATKVANTVTINYTTVNTNSGNFAPIFSSGGATSLEFYGLSLDVTDAANPKKVYSNTAITSIKKEALSDDPEFVGYSLVAPVIAADPAKEYTLQIVSSNTAHVGTKKIDVELTGKDGKPFVGSTAGHSFIISIYFKSNNEIICTAFVEDWKEEGEWQGEISVN
jgi:hypothetical protein